jgi:hypothetical protein
MSKVRIELHQVQQCFFSNRMRPVHVSANDGHHRKEILHIYYMHVVFYGLH